MTTADFNDPRVVDLDIIDLFASKVSPFAEPLDKSKVTTNCLLDDLRDSLGVIEALSCVQDHLGVELPQDDFDALLTGKKMPTLEDFILFVKKHYAPHFVRQTITHFAQTPMLEGNMQRPLRELNVGAMDSERVFASVTDRLGLPRLTDEALIKLYRNGYCTPQNLIDFAFQELGLKPLPGRVADSRTEQHAHHRPRHPSVWGSDLTRRYRRLPKVQPHIA